MRSGTHVEVRQRFDARWSRGFEIAEAVQPQAGVGEVDEAVDEPAGGAGARYRLRRRSDGSILPVLFAEDDLREERRRSTWWI